MRQAERFAAIVERLSANGSVDVGDLAAELGVSAATVRRDLALMEDQRLLNRTHGGAVAARIPDGSAVGMTGGTTTTEVARALADRERLTVVTNSLSIASELAVR